MHPLLRLHSEQLFKSDTNASKLARIELPAFDVNGDDECNWIVSVLLGERRCDSTKIELIGKRIDIHFGIITQCGQLIA